MTSTPGLSRYLNELEDHGYTVVKGQRNHWKILRDGFLVTSIAFVPTPQALTDAERNVKRYERRSLAL